MTYACLAWEFTADTRLMKLQHQQNKVLRTIRKFPRNAPIRVIHMHMHMVIEPNYAGNKPKSFNITRVYMLSIVDMATPDTENIRDLNLAVVRHMAVQMIKLVLQPELPLIGNNLLY
jgi:hypothetical protein